MYKRLAVSGYVLAGGRSSRMGRNKALLQLAGKPLVEHAVVKLRRICGEVAVLSNDAEMERFAPVVSDLHPDCGPMSGLEAALAHAVHDWSLVLPVDVPFVPSMLLHRWAETTLRHGERYRTRATMFEVGGIPQAALLMLHREMAPYLTDALVGKRYKLFPELEAGASDLARRHGIAAGEALRLWTWSDQTGFQASELDQSPRPPWTRTPEQSGEPARYFTNLNTPEDFAKAERYAHLLNT